MGGSQWLRIDEREDVLVSLSACLNSIAGSGPEPGLWKWAILALHNALQGAMVCHLSGTAQLGALSEKSAGKWLDWYERDRKGEIQRIDCGTDEMGVRQYRIAKGYEPPPERLADAGELFKRLSNAAKRIEPGAGGVIAITASERESFRRLHSLRNDLSHFRRRAGLSSLMACRRSSSTCSASSRRLPPIPGRSGTWTPPPSPGATR